MKLEELNCKDKELIKEAKKAAKRFSKFKAFGKKVSFVGAALRTKSGKIYLGWNIFHAASPPCSICSEYSAIIRAFGDGIREIDTIVAYLYRNKGKQKILDPCGKCREFMKIFGDPWIILKTKVGIRKTKLTDILPFKF